jgi:hypothetical protein
MAPSGSSSAALRRYGSGGKSPFSWGGPLVIVVVLGGPGAGGSFRLQRAWLERDNLLLGGVNMAAEVPGNVSAFG